MLAWFSYSSSSILGFVAYRIIQTFIFLLTGMGWLAVAWVWQCLTSGLFGPDSIWVTYGFLYSGSQQCTRSAHLRHAPVFEEHLLLLSHLLGPEAKPSAGVSGGAILKTALQDQMEEEKRNGPPHPRPPEILQCQAS